MISVGSMVTLVGNFADRAEHLYTGHRCEVPAHFGVRTRGTIGLVLETYNNLQGLRSVRLMVPGGRSGWIQRFYLEVL